MKQVIKWVADDGTPFNTEAECVEYEKINALSNFIENNIGRTYCDDAGYSVIEAWDVEKFIIENLPEINAIVNRQKELS